MVSRRRLRMKPENKFKFMAEKESVKLSASFEKKFKANRKAWAFFHSLPPSYHRPAIDWVMSAKQDATSIKRLDELTNDSEAGRKIQQLSY